MTQRFSRRAFLGAATAAPSFLIANDRPALLGGRPVRSKPFPSWPRITAEDERAVLEVLRSGIWCRNPDDRVARQFEQQYAALMGAKHCLATANGTSALFASLAALDIGPGDEVIVPPYTFVATINVVLLHHAIPIFVDTDLETFQIDPTKIEAAITERTRAIIPVHLGGNVADLDRILAIASKYRIPVIEDACQAHMAEWRGRKVGTYGTTGCFSFQLTKNLCSGEGGAILTNDDQLIERCYSFHNNGRGRVRHGLDFTYLTHGSNLRMTHFQAALLMTQMTRLEEQTRTREQNAAYLTQLLREIPGIHPANQYAGCTRNAYHLYMFRYDAEQFAGLSRDTFLKALRAEGIPCSEGYKPLNREPFLKNVMTSRTWQRFFPKQEFARWQERTRCPVNDRLCQQAVWFTQTMLLGDRSDMEQIAEAIRKIQKYAGELRKAA